MRDAFFIGLKTASSKIALPTTLECIENKCRIKKEISRFVIPVGASCNFDGTAIYIAVLCMFTSQMANQNLKLSDYVLTRFVR